jgi:hypothetical protein
MEKEDDIFLSSTVKQWLIMGKRAALYSTKSKSNFTQDSQKGYKN